MLAQEYTLNIKKRCDYSFIGFTFLANTTHNYLGVIVEDGKVKPNTYVGLVKKNTALVWTIIVKLSDYYERGTDLIYILVQSIFTTILWCKYCYYPHFLNEKTEVK